MSITQPNLMVFWWNKKLLQVMIFWRKNKVYEIFFPLLLQKSLNLFWPWIIVRPFFVIGHCSWEVVAFFFSEQGPTRSLLPNCAKLLRLGHEPSQNLIRICQFVTTYKFQHILYVEIRRNLSSKLARSDWELWKWGFKVNLHDFQNFIFLEVLILKG